jgi:hypothetical protein
MLLKTDATLEKLTQDRKERMQVCKVFSWDSRRDQLIRQ